MRILDEIIRKEETQFNKKQEEEKLRRQKQQEIEKAKVMKQKQREVERKKMREDMKRNTMMSQHGTRHSAMAVDIVGIDELELMESSEPPSEHLDDENNDYFEKLKQLKIEEERYAYLGWGEEVDEEQEEDSDQENDTNKGNRDKSMRKSNPKRVSAIRDEKLGIEILMVAREQENQSNSKGDVDEKNNNPAATDIPNPELIPDSNQATQPPPHDTVLQPKSIPAAAPIEYQIQNVQDQDIGLPTEQVIAEPSKQQLDQKQEGEVVEENGGGQIVANVATEAAVAKEQGQPRSGDSSAQKFDQDFEENRAEEVYEQLKDESEEAMTKKKPSIPSQQPQPDPRKFDQDTHVKNEMYMSDANSYMIQQVRERHGSKETDIVLSIIKPYDLNEFSKEMQEQVAEAAKLQLEPLGMTNEQQRADLISLVTSYLIIQNLSKK